MSAVGKSKGSGMPSLKFKVAAPGGMVSGDLLRPLEDEGVEGVSHSHLREERSRHGEWPEQRS